MKDLRTKINLKFVSKIKILIKNFKEKRYFQKFKVKANENLIHFFCPGAPLKVETEKEIQQAAEWMDKIDRKDQYKVLLTTLLVIPLGWMVVSQQPNHWIGWIFVIVGSLGTMLLLWKNLQGMKSLNKTVLNLEKEIMELKKR